MATGESTELPPFPPRVVGLPPPALPRRILLVLVAPGALFQRLREHPMSLATLLVGAALMAVSSLLIPGEIWEGAVREQLLEAGQDLPDDLGMVAQVGRIAAVLGPLVAWPLLALTAAGVYFLLFVLGMGYEGRYRQYLSVVAHALLVPALGALALVPLRIVTEDPQFSLTLGLLAPPGEGGFLRAWLGLLDLFNLWAYVLIGIGAATLDGRRGAGGAAAAAVGLALLLSGLLAAFIQ
jgi:hypothetical protein